MGEKLRLDFTYKEVYPKSTSDINELYLIVPKRGYKK